MNFQKLFSILSISILMLFFQNCNKGEVTDNVNGPDNTSQDTPYEVSDLGGPLSLSFAYNSTNTGQAFYEINLARRFAKQYQSDAWKIADVDPNANCMETTLSDNEAREISDLFLSFQLCKRDATSTCALEGSPFTQINYGDGTLDVYNDDCRHLKYFCDSALHASVQAIRTDFSERSYPTACSSSSLP